MKKWIQSGLIIIFFSFATPVQSVAQAKEIQQLILDIEKLSQFKKILQNMYDGYKILHGGYTTIRDIASGDFSLHKNFLDALMDISPAVKKYKRIVDIINYQIMIVKQYKSAFEQLKQSGSFSMTEIDYISKVYNNLFNESIKNIDELAIVITAGKLRMSDDERLKAIDRIYESITDQYSFLQDFNSSTVYLSLQRQTEQAEIDMSKKLSGY